jgi:pyrimidine-nucleoside phosphorylase
MRAVDLIRRKRDGGELAAAHIDAIVAGVVGGAIPDYQTAALLMAVCLRGMTAAETSALTHAMARSGARVTFVGLDGVPVDKHSTGGVGDKTSLVLAPLAAACGARIPMMSGRGLGHTGGTLDKLESIPGFRTALTLEEVQRAVRTIGCALAGQTEAIAPADRTLYALRDVTATVESIPLITASILSKKIAAGVQGLVLDVKTGDGAFMPRLEDSRALAASLVATGEAAGLRIEALITRMDAPLGRLVGNALEVRESIATLKGEGPPDLEDLSVRLAARLLVLAGIETDGEAALARVRQALASGAGLDVFRRIIANQGGDPRVCDDPSRLPSTPDLDDVAAPADGWVSEVKALAIGRAAVALGAGRATLADAIDPAVGLEVLAPPASRVSRGDPVVRIHHRQGRGLEEARALVSAAIAVADRPPAPVPLVVSESSARGAS